MNTNYLLIPLIMLCSCSSESPSKKDVDCNFEKEPKEIRLEE